MDKIARQAADFFPGQISTVKYIREETGFTLRPMVRLVLAVVQGLGDITLTYDPANPAQVMYFCYPGSKVDHKVTIRVRQTNHLQNGSRCLWAEVTHYEA